MVNPILRYIRTRCTWFSASHLWSANKCWRTFDSDLGLVYRLCDGLSHCKLRYVKDPV